LFRVSPAVLVAVIFMVIAFSSAVGTPASPTDESKVPHYFGPYPNWANSPFTLPDAGVAISGDGSGATAEATVGANGAVTGVNITNPGTGYTAATVTIGGTGAGATADATVTPTGIVTAIAVTAGGAGYTAPTVTISGGGATTQATATAFGKIDQLTLDGAGSGYTFPTVDIDWPDDPNGVQAIAHVEWDQNTGAITAIVLDNAGSGYAQVPNVVIRDGTLFDPITPSGTGATASATLAIDSVVVDTFGEGYTSAPTVDINDPTGTNAVAAATVDAGGVTAITLTAAGSGYITAGGMQKFIDPLPGLCNPGAAINDPVLGTIPACSPGVKAIPLAVPELKTYSGVEADEYVIALVQYKTNFSSNLPDTLVRGYVQLETPANAAVSQHYELRSTLVDGTEVPLTVNGQPAYGVTPPQYLGPTIVSQKNRPTRIVFHNLLPSGMDGDLFLPVDSTIMGSGMVNMSEPYDPTPVPGGTVMDMVRNPMCTDAMSMLDMCFAKNRATLHLHGGNSPWISDGTPHQWITPAGDAADPMTAWPEGVSVESVPDMNVCEADDDGCQTFYYSNQQSARLMFYHDHAWGITRLNVYAGEAAGYVITDATEQKLMGAGGALSGLGLGIPLVVQEKTFLPQDAQAAWQDPTWDYQRWGAYGSLWYHHVYMPAQNPGAPGGMSAFGRWMYGPWFWPPAGDAKYPPIDNPFFDPNCNLDDPATWQYQEDPFCEPPLIPGTPNISAGMEQFNDTPMVNGVVYPTVTVEPKTYRFRVLNAANDRFFNMQWYVGDPSTASTAMNNLPVPELIGATEVALNEAEVAAAQTDPVVFPTPDISNDGGLDASFSAPGPDWIQIGSESGFLPAPVVVDGQQVTTWITDPTRFDVGNVDQHSLLLAPAERADVIVDFSRFAGQTLILYNDAPAAFPARIPSYDYYTGAPDLRPVGAPSILPGYGPNTRTVMQVKVASVAPAMPFNLTKLRNAFSAKADGSGVFQSGQNPIIVGQSAYNSAYGSKFAASGWCNSPSNPSPRCDGYVRISEQGGTMFKFDTLLKDRNGTPKQVQVKIEPKAIQDETSESSFDEFGRMQANLGLEVVPAQPGLQNVALHPFTFPTTEILDASKLPAAAQLINSQYQDVRVTPIATGSDGSQIWRITHNGVDTHPIHFHATDVQLLNRVTWDNIIIPPDPTELGWKETIRVAPLEDTIVAMRPVVPTLPWDLPNSIRLLSPMMADGADIMSSTADLAAGFAPRAVAPNGDPIDVFNHYINFAAEYVYHCHILSHEEMDMMRPFSFAYAPKAPSGLAVTVSGNGANRTAGLSWTDNSANETGWEIQRATNVAGPWTTITTIPTATPLREDTGRSIGSIVTYQNVIGPTQQTFAYRVLAVNVVGDTWDYADPNLNQIVAGGFPTITVKSDPSNTATYVDGPSAPTNLTATLQAGPQVRLQWSDTATNETGFIVRRGEDGGPLTQLTVVGPRTGTGSVVFIDTSVVAGATAKTYTYEVAATNVAGTSGPSNQASVVLPAVPAAPSNFTAANGPNSGNQRSVILSWSDNSNNETGFTIQRGVDPNFLRAVSTANVPANQTSLTQTGLSRNTNYYYRIRAANGTIVFSGWVNATPFPIRTNP